VTAIDEEGLLLRSSVNCSKLTTRHQQRSYTRLFNLSVDKLCNPEPGNVRFHTSRLEVTIAIPEARCTVDSHRNGFCWSQPGIHTPATATRLTSFIVEVDAPSVSSGLIFRLAACRRLTHSGSASCYAGLHHSVLLSLSDCLDWLRTRCDMQDIASWLSGAELLMQVRPPTYRPICSGFARLWKTFETVHICLTCAHPCDSIAIRTRPLEWRSLQCDFCR